jgi:hypothetical protein
MKPDDDTIRGHPYVLFVNFCGTVAYEGHLVTIFISDLSDLQLFLKLVLVYDSEILCCGSSVFSSVVDVYRSTRLAAILPTYLDSFQFYG